MLVGECQDKRSGPMRRGRFYLVKELMRRDGDGARVRAQGMLGLGLETGVRMLLFAAKRAYWLLRCFFWVRKQRQNEHLLWTRISCALSCVEDRGVVPAGQFGPVRVTSRALPGHWKTWAASLSWPKQAHLKTKCIPAAQRFLVGPSPLAKLQAWQRLTQSQPPDHDRRFI